MASKVCLKKRFGKALIKDMYKLVIRPIAHTRILQALQYFDRTDLELSDKFLADLQDCHRLLKTFPQVFQKSLGPVRKAKLKLFSYEVYYRLEGQQVVILTLVHMSQDENSVSLPRD